MVKRRLLYLLLMLYLPRFGSFQSLQQYHINFRSKNMLKRLSITHLNALYKSKSPTELPNDMSTNLDHSNAMEPHSYISNPLVNKIKAIMKKIAVISLIPLLLGNAAFADDELAKYAAEGNSVGVDGQCFIRKCALETTKCANDPTCLKGLSCLARCKGGSMCSTGCFAKYGSDKLDGILYCSVEKNDCVHVPGKENTGWIDDKLSDLPGKPLSNFDIKSLDGTWYKVMGLDSRYDCFDCQRNSFHYKDKSTLDMEALFRIPRPSFPGYLQSKIEEELHATTGSSLAHLRSQGRMFGLTFWENWYILGETAAKSNPASIIGIPSAMASDPEVDLKLVFYTGHTLQGSYKGAFVYSRSPNMNERVLSSASDIIRKAGLNPNDFCTIRNACFLKNKDCTPVPKGIPSFTPSDIKVASSSAKASSLVEGSMRLSSESSFGKKSCSSRENDYVSEVEADPSKDAPFWYLGQRFFQVSRSIASELADWFEDPAILSDWLVSQQEHGLINTPLAVSPFASLPDDY